MFAPPSPVHSNICCQKHNSWNKKVKYKHKIKKKNLSVFQIKPSNMNNEKPVWYHVFQLKFGQVYSADILSYGCGYSKLQIFWSLCIAANRTWLYRLPQSKIIMYSFYLAYCYHVKHKKILAVHRVWAWWLFGRFVLTVRFPITWLGNAWEPVPPPTVQAWAAYLSPSFQAYPSDTVTCD